LVSVDDLWAGIPDWQKVFSNAPKDIPVVLLSHNPDAALFWLPTSEQEKFLTKHIALVFGLTKSSLSKQTFLGNGQLVGERDNPL